MSWDGVTERRVESARNTFCSQHLNVATDLAVIKETAKNIEQKMSESINFKGGVTTALISLGVALVIQIVTFAYFYGQMTKQIDINTGRLTVIETILRK